MQAVDQGFSVAFPKALDVEPYCEQAVKGFAELTQRAKDSGQLRADFVPEDLTLLLMANGGIIADSTEAALAASRRLVAYLLEAFRAKPTGPLPPPAPLDLRAIRT